MSVNDLLRANAMQQLLVLLTWHVVFFLEGSKTEKSHFDIDFRTTFSNMTTICEWVEVIKTTVKQSKSLVANCRFNLLYAGYDIFRNINIGFF